jgi:hypothetical protein
MVEGLETVLQRLTTARFIAEEAALPGQPLIMLVKVVFN